MELEPFLEEYEEARQAFNQLVQQHGWRTERVELAARGPAGEALAIDVAFAPGDEAGPTLMLTAGLHGAEGSFGSAVLRTWMARRDRAANVRAIVVHALNPWGFAHGRRFDDRNVDLNRNFLLEGEAYRGAPALYGALDRLLNPKPPRGWFDLFVLRAGGAVLRYGMTAVRQAVAGGQYEHPEGLFFGGSEPSEVQRVLSERWAEWIGPASRVVHLDFHTGLGEHGTGMLLLDQKPSVEQRTWLARQAAPLEVHVPGGEKAYEARGSFGRWCASRAPRCDYLYACAEYGTYPSLAVLGALRRENQARRGDDAEELKRARGLLREAFAPRDERWRRRVVEHAVGLVERCERGLGG